MQQQPVVAPIIDNQPAAVQSASEEPSPTLSPPPSIPMAHATPVPLSESHPSLGHQQRSLKEVSSLELELELQRRRQQDDLEFGGRLVEVPQQELSADHAAANNGPRSGCLCWSSDPAIKKKWRGIGGAIVVLTIAAVAWGGVICVFSGHCPVSKS
jgi:hypothetical protein